MSDVLQGKQFAAKLVNTDETANETSGSLNELQIRGRDAVRDEARDRHGNSVSHAKGGVHPRRARIPPRGRVLQQTNL